MWVYALPLTPKPECVIRRNEFLWLDIKHSIDFVFTLQWNARYTDLLLSLRLYISDDHHLTLTHTPIRVLNSSHFYL